VITNYNKIFFSQNFYEYLIFFLYSLLPIALISGPLISDIIISFSSLVFVIIIIYKKEFYYFTNIYSSLFWFWCFYLIIRSIFSDNPYLSLESSLFFFRFGIFSLSIFYLLKNYKNFKLIFCLSLLFCFSLLIIDGFIQYFFGNNVIGIPYTENRVSSFFGDEKILGSYLSRLFPLLIGLLIVNNFNKKITFYIILFIFVSSDILIFLSGERSAFFYLVLSTILFIMLMNNFKIVRIAALILSTIIIFIISVNYPQVKGRMVDKTISQLNIQSINENKYDLKEGKGIRLFSIQHQVIYTSAFRIFKDNIFFGIGPKMFREVCKRNKYIVKTNLDKSVDGCQTSPHNYYLQILTETGIFGIIPIIIIFFSILYLFIKQIYFKIFYKKIFLNDFQISLLICLFITLWPIAPTGNFFGNNISIIHFLPLGFLIYSFKKV
jgi:O-antigen ligase